MLALIGEDVAIAVRETEVGCDNGRIDRESAIEKGVAESMLGEEVVFTAAKDEKEEAG